MKFALFEISVEEILSLKGLPSSMDRKDMPEAEPAHEHGVPSREDILKQALQQQMARLDPKVLETIKGMLGRPSGGVSELASLAFSALSSRGKLREAGDFLRSHVGDGLSREILLELIEDAISRKNGGGEHGGDGDERERD